MAFQSTSVRLWKRLTPKDRLAASTHFWRETPEEMIGTATAAIVKARHTRPQVARALPAEEKARIVATIIDPGEPLAAALLVALHVGERRALLAAFLDALGWPHEDGIIKDDAAPQAPPTVEQARAAVEKLRAQFPAEEIETYLNTLWLQEPERWSALQPAAEWLATHPRPD